MANIEGKLSELRKEIGYARDESKAAGYRLGREDAEKELTELRHVNEKHLAEVERLDKNYDLLSRQFRNMCDELEKSKQENIELAKQLREARASKSNAHNEFDKLYEMASKKVNLIQTVKNAEADIENLVARGPHFKRTDDETGNAFYSRYAYTVKFHVNPSKGYTTALLFGAITPDKLTKATAKCHPNDDFNESIGKAIALRRALGLEVPSEYLGG